MATAVVRANGLPLPLFYVSPSQINLYLPVTLLPTAPGIFALGQGGQGQGAVLIGGTAQVADERRPARPLEAVEIYGTGFGVARAGGRPVRRALQQSRNDGCRAVAEPVYTSR
jgi:hypothetical protein